MLPPRDTSAEAWAVQVGIWRRMGDTGRTSAALQMTAFSRQCTLDAIRGRHPDYDERQAFLAFVRLLYGDILYAAAWPGQPLLSP